ncbi:MAG: gamma-glutamyl:cysteine ligase YbdK (ATP-grasp superfamily) [Arenicella sp.]|jgi:gamma-glutamyl:cysteine ligase YbdK (ATP-grasp superfamily)
MGDEISDTKFSAEVFEEFRNRLDMETVILQSWIDEGKLRCDRPWAGCELEAWLTDGDGNPAPNNDELLSKLDNKLVVPELAKFNIELNTEPLAIESGFLETMHSNLLALWQDCERTALSQGRSMTMIGILPSVKQSDLCMENQSNMKRYLALNEQIFRLRNGAPLQLKIEGKESLEIEHFDVMLEAAATSLQIHYKVDIDKAVTAYNASRILSAPIVAMSANSPFLFGHDLWAESRIPLFEQAVKVGGSAYSNRVSFGIRHAGESIMECFNVNRVRYPTLLPQLMDTPPEELAHLRMHNGTIWRWNRPLVGFSESGEPHIRIEHRVPAAGPSMVDTVANAAFYFGALTALLGAPEPIEKTIPNRDAAHNFYECAKHGLDAQVLWRSKQPIAVKELIIQELLPLAKRGLLSIGYNAVDADYWLDIIKQRVTSGQNGASWQRNWVSKYGRDFKQLVLNYHDNQASNIPVHTWML